MYVCDATGGIMRAKSSTSIWTLRHRARAIEHRYVTLDHAAKLLLKIISVVEYWLDYTFFQSHYNMKVSSSESRT